MRGVPDAWDECGGCGHDRDDHDGPGSACRYGVLHEYPDAQPICDCRSFTEEAA